jgi:hypothetical protein
MKAKLKNLLIVVSVILLTATFALAQEDTSPKQKLRSGVTVKGEVGGEAHQSYVLRVRKGQTITLQISRRVPKGGNFNLTVSRSADFFNASGVKFGKETSGRTFLRWTGKAPSSGNYYFYLTGHNPNDSGIISYRLTATVK